MKLVQEDGQENNNGFKRELKQRLRLGIRKGLETPTQHGFSVLHSSCAEDPVMRTNCKACRRKGDNL
jgi:hypothetical protein